MRRGASQSVRHAAFIGRHLDLSSGFCRVEAEEHNHEMMAKHQAASEADRVGSTFDVFGTQLTFAASRTNLFPRCSDGRRVRRFPTPFCCTSSMNRVRRMVPAPACSSRSLMRSCHRPLFHSLGLPRVDRSACASLRFCANQVAPQDVFTPQVRRIAASCLYRHSLSTRSGASCLDRYSLRAF